MDSAALNSWSLTIWQTENSNLDHDKNMVERLCIMSEKELQRLYDLLEKVKDEDEKAALRHAIFILESNS